MRLFRIPCIEVVEESHRRTDENRETGDSNSRLCLKLEESKEHGEGDTSATDSRYRAQGHDKAKDENTDNLERFLRENILVLTN